MERFFNLGVTLLILTIVFFGLSILGNLDKRPDESAKFAWAILAGFFTMAGTALSFDKYRKLKKEQTKNEEQD
jgi:hypothetical protein